MSIKIKSDCIAVLYFFKTNGKYAASRGETRKILGQNFVDKYSYFSKFEWQFYGRSFSGRVYPDKAATIEASEKFLSVVNFDKNAEVPNWEFGYWPNTIYRWYDEGLPKVNPPDIIDYVQFVHGESDPPQDIFQDISKC